MGDKGNTTKDGLKYKGNDVIDLSHVDSEDLRGLVVDSLIILCIREDCTMDEQLKTMVFELKEARTQIQSFMEVLKAGDVTAKLRLVPSE